MKKLRIYVDTSVFGGCFDAEFEKYSKELFELFERKEAIAVVSSVVYAEVNSAPANVQAKLKSLPEIEGVDLNPEIDRLSDEYLKAEIVTRKYAADAMHIAIATYYHVDVLVSWNFRHIVNFRKIHQFNGVNVREGYNELDIRSPLEMVNNEKR